MKWCFDKSLADLETITATVNRTRSEASRENPAVATITCEIGLMSQILTAASLHMSDNPFVPKPETGDHADTIRLNNLDNQAYHWQMRDSITYMSGALSKAADPQYGDDKRRSIALDREIRKLKVDGIIGAKGKEHAEADEDVTSPDELRSKWEATNVPKLTDAQTLGLMVTLLEEDRPVSREIAMQLFQSFREASAKAQKAEEMMAQARKLLGGF